MLHPSPHDVHHPNVVFLIVRSGVVWRRRPGLSCASTRARFSKCRYKLGVAYQHFFIGLPAPATSQTRYEWRSSRLSAEIVAAIIHSGFRRTWTVCLVCLPHITRSAPCQWHHCAGSAAKCAPGWSPFGLILTANQAISPAPPELCIILDMSGRCLLSTGAGDAIAFSARLARPPAKECLGSSGRA